MLLSIALILLVGMSLGWVCQKLKLPSLIGMLIAGILLGPHGFHLLDASILSISSDIRKIALIIILTRAGLSLDLTSLKKVGRSAIMMCFVPASFELFGILLLGPSLLGMTLLESAVTGAVLAAVSPAVVVPRMVRLMETGYGTKQGIPQLILASASVDDVYVIVLFTTFTSMMSGGEVSVISFINIPFSILTGIILGLFVGYVFSKFLSHVSIKNVTKVLILLSISFVLVAIEDHMKTALTFSALISIMFFGVAMQKYTPKEISGISSIYQKLWIAGEVFLFVLVGATVNISYLGHVGLNALLMILGALCFRMLGVFICLLGTPLIAKERLFTMLAYTPKATVQAAIGGIPLALGFACGDTTLAVSVLAIVVTAPLGAFAIDFTYTRLLQKSKA